MTTPPGVGEPLGDDRVELPGTSLRLPVGWIRDTRHPSALLVAKEPRGNAFSANLTVVREGASAEGAGCVGDDRIRTLADELDGFQLVDLEALPVAGADGLRLMFCHLLTGRGVACEQWLRADRTGTTVLSQTCLALDRDHYGPLFAAVVAEWCAVDG